MRTVAGRRRLGGLGWVRPHPPRDGVAAAVGQERHVLPRHQLLAADQLEPAAPPAGCRPRRGWCRFHSSRCTAAVPARAVIRHGAQLEGRSPGGGEGPANHWITSSARASSDGGIVRPSALAVLRLMANWKLVGRSMGRSAGRAPFRIRSTYLAACLKSSP
jgi:hypothetical protein